MSTSLVNVVPQTLDEFKLKHFLLKYVSDALLNDPALTTSTKASSNIASAISNSLINNCNITDSTKDI